MENIDRRQFLKVASMTAAGVLLAGGAEHQAAQSGAQVAEASHAVHTPYGVIHGLPHNPEYHAPEGALNRNQGKGLETFFDRNGSQFSSLPTRDLGSLRRDGGVYILEPNSQTTIVGANPNLPFNRTYPLSFRVEAGQCIRFAGGEGKIQVESPNGSALLDLYQIDNQPGRPRNPHQNQVYIFCYIDPTITISEAVSGHAIMQMMSLDSKQVVSEDLVYRMLDLSPSSETTAVHALDIRGFRYGQWLTNKGSHDLSLVYKNY